MKNATIYIWAKKIHRILVPLIIITGVAMMITGASMKYDINISISPSLIRYIHNQVSALFSFALAGMALTGSYLFLFPFLK